MSWQLFWLLVEAARLTVVLSVVSIGVFGFLIAIVVCAGMLSGNRVAAGTARLFVSFFRGTPLLVQLLLIYYLLPSIGLDVPSEVAAIAGMSLCTAAYQAEIMRGGFAGVSRGMVEAAEMTGMSGLDIFRRIRLPVAFRLTLPALTNEWIMMLKSSSLVSVVGVVELTRMAQDLAASTYRPLELYAAAGFIYLCINVLVALLGRGLEARLSWGRV